MQDVYFGAGCFWHVQHEFVEAERKLLNRKDKELTSRTGYAGGLKTDGEGRVRILLIVTTIQLSIKHKVNVFFIQPDTRYNLLSGQKCCRLDSMFRFVTTIFNQLPIMENWDMVKLLA